jgi:molecular chaperone HtpG
MGVMDDKKNKSKLVKLLRFKSSKSDGAWTSFEEYVDRMKENQDKIYYLTCESLAACESNPIMEKFKARDLEVLYMDDPIDEYASQQINEFDGIDPVNAMRESATLSESKEFSKLSKSEDSSELVTFFKKVLGSRVSKVLVSNKLTTSPAACTAPEYGWTGNMERIMRAQALQQQKDIDAQLAQKVFEFNPYHPIIQEINKRRRENADDETLVDLVHILFESASVVSGYSMAEPEVFAKRIHKVVSLGLDVDPEAKVSQS